MAARVVLVGVSVALVVADGVAYLWVIHRQHEGGPAWWYVGSLCVVILLALGSLRSSVRGAGVAGAVGGVLAIGLGILGIFSVGLPIAVAGVLLLIAAILAKRQVAAGL